MDTSLDIISNKAASRLMVSEKVGNISIV